MVNPTTARCEAVVVPPLPPSRVLHAFPWPRAIVAGGSPAADCPAPAPAKVTAVPPPAASRKRARPAAKRATACTARGRGKERAVRQRTREDEAALSLISIGCGSSDGGDSDDTADTTVGTTATAVPMWRLYIQAAASAGVQRPWESARCRTAATSARRRRVRATTGKRAVEGARSAGSGAKATQEVTGGLRDRSATGCDGNATDHRGPMPRGGHLAIKADAGGDCSDAFRLWLVSVSATPPPHPAPVLCWGTQQLATC